jgi:hypothetical protein
MPPSRNATWTEYDPFPTDEWSKRVETAPDSDVVCQIEPEVEMVSSEEEGEDGAISRMIISRGDD